MCAGPAFSQKVTFCLKQPEMKHYEWLGYLHLTNQADNSIGTLCTSKANKTQKWVSNSDMNVKVCMCDIRYINQVNIGTS